MTAVVIGVGYAIALVVFLTLIIGWCKAAAEGDDIARGMLGQASSDPDFDFAVMDVLVDDPTPAGRRHA